MAIRKMFFKEGVENLKVVIEMIIVMLEIGTVMVEMVISKLIVITYLNSGKAGGESRKF